MPRHSETAKLASKTPFNYPYDRSGYVVLSSCVERVGEKGIVVRSASALIQEPKKKKALKK